MNNNEEELIADFQSSGNINYDLIRNNEGIINLVINRYYCGFTNDRDDLYQEGVLGLIEAFKKYSVDKSFGFFNYKVLWVRKKMQLYFNKNIKNKLQDISEDRKTIHFSNSERSDKLRKLFDIVNDSNKISDDEKREILFAMENVNLKFLKSKTINKLKKIVIND
jgi:DNA-directed RNA polymerase specialized sigma subunit